MSPSGRSKRRRDDTERNTEEHLKLSKHAETTSQSITSFYPSRHAQTPETTPIFSADVKEGFQTLERRNIHPKPRRLHDSKRQRVSIDSQHLLEHGAYLREAGHSLRNTPEQHSNDMSERTEPAREAIKKIDLNPCHICRRKPTVKSELDQYADCEGCGRRTCYICIRECLGSGFGSPCLGDYDMEGDYDVLAFSFTGDEPALDGRTRNGRERTDSGYEGGDENADSSRVWEKGRLKEHKRMICSGCCVERGTEGEVWCLGCLRAENEP